jgi:hypothetical protein
MKNKPAGNKTGIIPIKQPILEVPFDAGLIRRVRDCSTYTEYKF